MAVYFMGIDVGTNESKGVIINEQAEVICTASASHGVENPAPHLSMTRKKYGGEMCAGSPWSCLKSPASPTRM